MDLKNISLDFATDTFVIVKFQDRNSVLFDIIPTNMTPLQMLVASLTLKKMGEQRMDEANLREVISDELRKILEEKPKILLPK